MALLLGAAVVVSGPVAAADPISPGPGTLTFCGVTHEATFPQPKPDLPKNLQDSTGAFVGDWVGPGGTACMAMLVQVSSSDGSASLRVYEGAGIIGDTAGSWLHQVQISNNTFTYSNRYGFPLTMTLLDPNHLQVKYHNPAFGQSYNAILERVREDVAK